MQDPKSNNPEIKVVELDPNKQPAKVTEPDGNKAAPPIVAPTAPKPDSKQA